MTVRVCGLAVVVHGLSDLPSVLVARPDSKEDWQRLSPGGTVHTGDTLLALPGFTGIVRTKSGVALLLRSRGVDTTDPLDRGGMRSIYFRDPDGHILEITA